MLLRICCFVLLLTSVPAAASDFALMVGLRSTIASSIRDAGYECEDVVRIEWLGASGDEDLLKVQCGSSAADPRHGSAFRVLADVDGDFAARPWRELACELALPHQAAPPC